MDIGQSVYILMYGVRNRATKERFKTQTIKQQPNLHHKQSVDPYSATSIRSPVRQNLSNSRSQPSVQIISSLQQHVHYLEKKLHEAESQKERLSNNNEWLKSQVMEKEALIIRMTNRVGEEESRVKEISQKYQTLKGELQNHQLKAKMDRLSQELNQEKMLNQQKDTNKKDRFSGAFLPSPFGSPKHVHQRSPQSFKTLTNQSFQEPTSPSRNPFESSLWSEWRKLKSQNSKKQSQIAVLTSKLQDLASQLTKEKKQTSRLKTQCLRSEEKAAKEIQKLKGRIGNYIKDQKLLMVRAKNSEERLMEMSLSMKGEDGERFFAHSSTLQLQQIFEKISHNLEHDSSTVEVTISQIVPAKKEQDSQTLSPQASEASQVQMRLQQRIVQLEAERQSREKEWFSRLQEAQEAHQEQLKQLLQMGEVYKSRIGQLEEEGRHRKRSSIAEDPQQQSNYVEQGVECLIWEHGLLQTQSDIMDKVRALIELNETQQAKIVKLEEENRQLVQNTDQLQYKLDKQRLKVLISSKEGPLAEQEPLSESECLGCSRSKQSLMEKQLHLLQSTEQIEELLSQKQHYMQAFNDKLTQYSELQAQTEKIKQELQQRQQQVKQAQLESELKNQEMSRDREQTRQLKSKLSKLQKQIEVYEEQLQRYQQ